MTSRLRSWSALAPAPSGRNNRHIPCVCEHAGQPGLASLHESGEDLDHASARRCHCPSTTARTPAAGGCRVGPAVPARHRRPSVVRGALRRPAGLARRDAAGERGAAAGDHRPVAPRRVRPDRAAWPGAGVVLADPGRDDRHRAAVPRRPARSRPPRAHPRGAGGADLDAGQRHLGRGPALVALRTPPARGPARGGPGRARGGRGDPLAVPGPLPLRRAGVGDRGGADPEGGRRGRRGSWPGCCPRCGTPR